MPAQSYRNLQKIIIIILLTLVPSLVVRAHMDSLKEEARSYRDKGYQAQSSGDLDTAMSYYQKAIELNPLCAAAHNDLGVIYEIKGLKDRAQDSYMKSIQADHNYSSAYFNLANLYEEQGNFRKAADFWKKRIRMGDPNDPWTQKARSRLENIGMLVEDIGRQLKQEETADLIKSVSQDKDYLESKASNVISKKKEKARTFFSIAKEHYARGNYAAALKDASTAQFLDPSNTEIEEFADKIRGKINSYSQ